MFNGPTKIIKKSPEKNWACHGCSRCDGIYIHYTSNLAQNQIYSCIAAFTPSVTGLVFMRRLRFFLSYSTNRAIRSVSNFTILLKDNDKSSLFGKFEASNLKWIAYVTITWKKKNWFNVYTQVSLIVKQNIKEFAQTNFYRYKTQVDKT